MTHFSQSKRPGQTDFTYISMGNVKELTGTRFFYFILQLIRDCLTDSNLPSGQCMICLFGFTKGDEFVRTQCYHYFHSHCLAAHLISGRRYHQEELELLPNWQQVTRAPFKVSLIYLIYKCLCFVCDAGYC